MSAVRLMLALCVVMRLQSARSQSAGALSETEPASSQCDGGTLEMMVDRDLTKLYDSRLHKNNKVEIAFGTSARVRVRCSGLPTARLTLTKNGDKIQTQRKNDNSILLWLHSESSDSQKSVYVCNDIETGCQRSVIIYVKPVLEVKSKYELFPTRGSNINCTIEYGNSVTVFCSAPADAKLVITKDGKELLTERESKYTIKYFDSKPDQLISKYVCTDVYTSLNSSAIVKVIPLVYEYIRSRNETINGYKYLKRCDIMHSIDIAYDDSVEIICRGPRGVELISPGPYSEEIATVNGTVVQLFLKKLKLNSSVFSCVNSELPDCKNTVRVNARPRMDVRSPNVRRVEGRYIVKYGDPVEIICSGIEAEHLAIYKINFKKRIQREVQSINETTIRYHASLDVFDDFSTFECSTGKAAQSVDVSVLPEAVDFSCVSHAMQYLNCSWRAAHYNNKFTLSYRESGVFVNICTKLPKFSYLRFCTWDCEEDIEVFSFLMQSCSDLGCFNQTFRFDQVTILKLAPPESLRVGSTSSFDAMLSWQEAGADIQIAGKYFYSHTGDFLYKVVYWYSGIKPREVNASLVSCDHVYCEINLRLPCPATSYEVRVYQKLKTAIGEEFWSDPSTVTFVTDDNNNKNTAVDSTCNWKPKVTKEVMVYATQMLRYEVESEMLKFKKKVAPLKDKVALIRTLQQQIGEFP